MCVPRIQFQKLFQKVFFDQIILDKNNNLSLRRFLLWNLTPCVNATMNNETLIAWHVLLNEEEGCRKLG